MKKYSPIHLVALFTLTITLGLFASTVLATEQAKISVEIPILSEKTNPPKHMLPVSEWDAEAIDQVLAETTEIRENIFRVKIRAGADPVTITQMVLSIPDLDRSGNTGTGQTLVIEEASLFLGEDEMVDIHPDGRIITKNRIGTYRATERHDPHILKWGMEISLVSLEEITLTVQAKFGGVYSEANRNIWPPAVYLANLEAMDENGLPAKIEFDKEKVVHTSTPVRLVSPLTPETSTGGLATIKLENNHPYRFEPGDILQLKNEVVVVMIAKSLEEVVVLRASGNSTMFGQSTNFHYEGEEITVYAGGSYVSAPSI